MLPATRLLDSMTPGEILEALILNKSGSRSFSEEALYHGLEEAAAEYPRLRAYFRRRKDDMGWKIEAFYDTLFFLKGGHVIMDRSSDAYSDFLYMPASSQDHVLKELRKNHGPDVLNALRPVADAVWEAAGNWQARTKREYQL